MGLIGPWSLLLPTVQAEECFIRDFPKLIGSELDAANNFISTVEVDNSNGLMYLGGTSSDTNIVAVNPSPIIVKFDTVAEDFVWRVQYSSAFLVVDF